MRFFIKHRVNVFFGAALLTIAGVAPSASGQTEQEAVTTPSADLSAEALIKPVGLIGTSISHSRGPVPTEQAIRNEEAVPGSGPHAKRIGVAYSYASAATKHGGLLYQDVDLERYGHHYGRLQPFVSAGHFARRTLLLPYTLAAERPWRTTYTLGYGRPGSYTTPKFYLTR